MDAAMKQSEFLDSTTCIGTDGSGKIYCVAKYNGDTCITVSDASKELLASTSAPDAKPMAQLESVAVSSIIKTSPKIDFDVSDIQVSQDGQYVILRGCNPVDDTAVVALVDVYGGQVDSRKAGHPVATRTCSLFIADYQHFSSRPGLKVLQVSWHQHSPNHFAVLTSDSRFKLYNIKDLTLAEQTFQLKPTDSRARAFAAPGLQRSSSVRITSFAFAAPVSWSMFSIFFLASNGTVFLLCPVAPFGFRCQPQVLQQMTASLEGGWARNWLQAAFGSAVLEAADEGNFQRHGLWTVQPHMLESAAPALLGPLNANAESVPDETSSGPALAMACSHYVEVQGGGGGGYGADESDNLYFTALLTSFANGYVFAHAVDDLQVSPSFQAATPSCIQGPRGELLAVRCDADALSLADRARAAGEETGSNPLLLLDLVDLQVGSEAAPLAAADDSSDDEEGPSAGGNLLARKGVQLSSCAGIPGRFWACHSKGAWALSIQWLPHLAEFLMEANQQDAPDVEQLPAPALQELLVADSPVTGMAAVHNVLLGSGCLVLCPQGPGRLAYLRPRVVGRDPAAAALSPEAPSAGPPDESIDDQLQALYAELLAGPRNVALPKPSGPAGSQNAEGVAYLHQAIVTLNEKHVQYAHGAHDDLKARLAAVQDAVGQQDQSVGRLSELLHQSKEGQAGLSRRIERCKKVHANLVARLQVLTSLHWSVPRPLSEAEHELRSQLDSYEKQQGQLAVDWALLKRSVKAAVQRVQPGGSAAAGSKAAGLGSMAGGVRSTSATAPIVPASQLDRLHAALKDQTNVITTAMQQLQQMAGDLRAYEQQQAEAAVAAAVAGGVSNGTSASPDSML